jgi:hypothetical protein
MIIGLKTIQKEAAVVHFTATATICPEEFKKQKQAQLQSGQLMPKLTLECKSNSLLEITKILMARVEGEDGSTVDL